MTGAEPREGTLLSTRGGLFLVFCLVAFGCSEAPSPDRPALGTDTLGGDVIALVNGTGITVGDVEAIAARDGIEARPALDLAIREALLAQEASRLGFAERPATQRSADRAAVRALLSEAIETAIPETSITEQDIADAYQAEPERWTSPDRRAALHLLVRTPDEPSPEDTARAQAIAAELHGAVASAADPAEAMARLEQEPSEMPLLLEPIEEFANDGSLEAAFAEAAFSMTEPGLYPGFVDSSYGSHVLLVTEVIASRTTSLEDARDSLFTELLAVRRHEALVALEATLQSQIGVELDETVARQQLSRDLEFEAERADR